MYWYDDIRVLIDFKYLNQFWPSNSQNVSERFNSFSRLIIYIGILLSLNRKNLSPFLVSIFILFCLALITKYTNKKKKNIPTKLIKKNICRLPTVQNPLMNRLPFDSPFKKDACNPLVVSTGIDQALFSDFPDKLSNDNKERIKHTFFSNPKPLVNKQFDFAQNLYGGPNKRYVC